MSEVVVPEKIVELIECFRAGVDDLSQPEFQELGRWIEQNPKHAELVASLHSLDAELTQTFVEVPVPANLADNIKAALPGLSAPDAQSLASRPKVAPKQNQRAWYRRQHAVTGTTAGLVVAILILASLLLVPRTPDATTNAAGLTNEMVAEQAIQWSEMLDDETKTMSANWITDQNQIPDGYALGDAHDFKIRSWTRLSTDKKEPIIAYNATIEDQSFRLFAFRPNSSINLLASELTIKPVYRTSKFCAGIFRTGELVGVLVVDGSIDDYREVVKKTMQTKAQ